MSLFENPKAKKWYFVRPKLNGIVDKDGNVIEPQVTEIDLPKPDPDLSFMED